MFLNEKAMNGMWGYTISEKYNDPIVPSEKCLITFPIVNWNGPIWGRFTTASSSVIRNMNS